MSSMVSRVGSFFYTHSMLPHVSLFVSLRTSELARYQVAQLEEYMKTLDTNLAPLSEALGTMMECNEVSGWNKRKLQQIASL